MTNPKYLIPLLCVLFAGCTNTSNKENLAYQFIKPIPADKSLFNGDLKELNATTLPALFSFTDFNWKDSTLTLTAYSIDTYKASEIDNLQKGDTILFRNDTIITDKIERGRYISINGGIEFGGVDLTAHEEGTYRVLLMDNHPQYSQLGKVKLPLSPALTIIDCGDNPEDPSDTIRTNHRQWLANVKEYKRDFSELNTRVNIENGIITTITRFWIP